MNRTSITSLVAAAAIVLAPAGVRAQVGNASDVTGPSTPAIVGGIFGPGGTTSVPLTPEVGAAIVRASGTVLSEANPVRSPITNAVLPAAAVHTAVLLMSNSLPEIRAEFRAALLPSGASSDVIDALIRLLPSLLTNPEPGQLQKAIRAFNAVVGESSASFLANPPAVFLAAHAILAQLSAAAQAARP